MSKSKDFGNLLLAAAAVASLAVTFGGSALLGGALTAWKVGALALGVASAVHASQYQRRKAREAYNASLTDRESMISTFATVRSRIYGRARNVDGIVFKGTRGDKSQFYTLVIALAGHEVDAIESVYFNDDLVTIDGSGKVSTEPYGFTAREAASVQPGSGQYSVDLGSQADMASVQVWVGGRWVAHTVAGTVVTWAEHGFGATNVKFQKLVPSSRATIKKYLGAPGQDLSGELASRFPGLITSDHKFSGIACLLVDLEYDENAFTTGVPNISAVVRGAKVLDPRTGVTAWSENPSLCARDWALYSNGGGCASDEVDAASFNTAANACDVLHTYLDSKGGSSTVPLYRCAYVAKLDVSPETHLAELVESMAGKWAWAGGKLRVRAGVYSTPVATLDESWLSEVGSGRQIIPETGIHDLVNSYRVTIADSSNKYSATQLPALAPAAYLSEDGYEMPAEIEMGAVSFAPQAQHIAGVFLRDQRDGLTFTLTCNMKAWRLEVFDVVSVSIARYGWVNKAFEVLGWSHAPSAGISLVLKETGASIFSPDSLFQVGDQIPNTSLPRPWDLPVITGLTASSGTSELMIGADGSVVTRVRIAFDPISNESVLNGGVIEVGWTNGDVWEYQEFSGSSNVLWLTGLLDGSPYVITARCKNRVAAGRWCRQIGHTVVGKTERPPTVDSFTIETQPDGTRILRGGYTSETRPVDLAGYRIRYRQGSGPFAWSEMVPFQTDTGFFTTLPIETNQLLAGAYTLAIVGVDTTGNESATPKMIVATLPNPRLGNALQLYTYQELGWPGVLSNAVVDTDSGASCIRAVDQATWATLPSTWSAWTRWVWNPVTSWSFTTAAADFGSVVQTLPVVSVDGVGAFVVEEQHSNDGASWTAWASIAAPFNARYVKVRVSVSAEGPTGPGVTQVTSISGLTVIYTGKVTAETGNDINPAALSAPNRIAVGDIRLPLTRTYASISRVYVAIQGVTGNWSWVLVDKSTAGPRIQFYNASGVLADPPLIDFTVEGIAS